MSGELTLRDCRYSDLKAVMAIERESFPDPYPLLEFALQLTSPRTKFTVACIDEKVVGYIIARRESHRGEIRSIAVLPEFRGRGAGRALMRAAMDYLEGCDHIWLLVEKTNTAAIALYRSLSFKETGRIIEGYYPSGGDALELVWKRP